jgi:hypothetical protein
MSILNIKTNLSEAFGKTGYSKSKPFESINPPKQGEYPVLLPTEIREQFDIGNPVSSPMVTIDQQQTKFKISDFSAGDVIHTQPYISQEIRRKVRFPATQIKDHKIRISKFLDSPEGSLFIANQSMLHTFNAMPESFAGLTAANGLYKVYKRSDNRVFSPIGILGSSIPGFHVERHKISRGSTKEAYGKFAAPRSIGQEVAWDRSDWIKINFPSMIPTQDRIDLNAENSKTFGILGQFGEAFARRIQPAFQNQISSIVEQAFVNPRKITIKKVGEQFKSYAATALGGSIGELLGAGARSLTERGVAGISDFFGGFNSNINLGSSRTANFLSAAVNAGANIIVDTISTVAQRTFAEQVAIQANKAGMWVGKYLGIDPKFVTNSLQAAFAKDAIVLSQVSPGINLNRFNIRAPYYKASHHMLEIEKTNIFVQKGEKGKRSQAGFARLSELDPEAGEIHALSHISRQYLNTGLGHGATIIDPFVNLDTGETGLDHRQIHWTSTPYEKLVAVDGIGSFHPIKQAQDFNPQLYGETSYIEKEKADSLGKYSKGKGQDGSGGPQRVDDHLGLMRKAERSDQVTIARPGPANDSLVPDFVPFAFTDVHNNRRIQFRAILGAVTDTTRPEYEPLRYLGRPDQVYIYKGAVRNINFTFKFAAFTKQELIIGWEKLNYLVGLCYPAGYEQGRMVAPLVKLTIGKMFDNAPGLVNNVSLTVPDQSTWDINPNLELPKYIEASIDFQYIGAYSLKAKGKHYGLTYMKDDGSALTTELDATLSDVNRGRYSSGRASAFDNSGYAERQNMIGRARQASHDDIIESQINDKMIGGIASLRQQVLGNG